MPLPPFNDFGDLPEGIHQVTLKEVLERFGNGSPVRQQASTTLNIVFQKAIATKKLRRFIVFGSFVTSKPDPNDVDVIMVMDEEFTLSSCDPESRMLFDHQSAERVMGASIFWLIPSVVFRETLDEFIAHWGIKRDLTYRGIVEVIYDQQ
jgi:hypothetical protein